MCVGPPAALVREFGFELALCAHLEAPDTVVSRQLGAHVHGRRVLDVVQIEPGPGFDARAAITPDAIPAAAIESDVGAGEARYWKRAFDAHPETARAATERAIEVGFFDAERRGGRTYVRQTARYPDWVGGLLGIECKPDLDRPGALETQLLTDVHLALVDRVVLATASHVTGAHRNRLPEPVGIWRFDPERGEREVVREAAPLAVDDPGVEILERQPARADVRIASAAEKHRSRRRLAERAYGKGWRSFARPGCANCEATADGRPHCRHFERVVDTGAECGTDCPGYAAGAPIDTDRLTALRDARSAWVRAAGGPRTQAGLDRFR
jgi:hypothetical protein